MLCVGQRENTEPLEVAYTRGTWPFHRLFSRDNADDGRKHSIGCGPGRREREHEAIGG